MKLPPLALTLTLLPAGQLLADVLISANRQVEARNDSSATNTVFTHEDIDRLQPDSVTDLLRR
ncbi:outer membrane cobalamin receptor [Pseudomonas baetica]|nr:outer membrane cobalamin receptor [Pseudomonas baetica]